MSENRRYFWLKLMTNFFDGDDIKIVEIQPNGAEYIIFWLKLLLRAVTSKEAGVLRYRESIPYTPDVLSTVTGTNIDIVKGALSLFDRLGMIKISDRGDIFIEQIIPLIGSETDVAKRVRAHRKRTKRLENRNNSLPLCVQNAGQKGTRRLKNQNKSLPAKEIKALHCNTELELELELEKSKIREEKNSQNSEIPEFSVLGNDSLSLSQKREARIKLLAEQAQQLKQAVTA